MERRLQAAEQRALRAEQRLCNVQTQLQEAEHRIELAEQRAQRAEEVAVLAEKKTQMAEENGAKLERKLYEVENELVELLEYRELLHGAERFSVQSPSHQHELCDDNDSISIFRQSCNSGYLIPTNSTRSLQVEEKTRCSDQISITSL